MKLRIVTVILFLLIAIVAGFYWHYQGVPYAEELADKATQLVQSLLVITIFVERATAVIGSIMFDKEIAIAAVEEQRHHMAWKNEESSEESKNAFEATRQRVAIEEEKSKVRDYLALFIGLFVSAVGVRTLSSLQQLDNISEGQKAAYFVVDIILTAGLIAGGSAGVAGLTGVLSKYLDKVKARLASLAPLDR